MAIKSLKQNLAIPWPAVFWTGFNTSRLTRSSKAHHRPPWSVPGQPGTVCTGPGTRPGCLDNTPRCTPNGRPRRPLAAAGRSPGLCTPSARHTSFQTRTGPPRRTRRFSSAARPGTGTAPAGPRPRTASSSRADRARKTLARPTGIPAGLARRGRPQRVSVACPIHRIRLV
jgi:hypothetical protein